MGIDAKAGSLKAGEPERGDLISGDSVTIHSASTGLEGTGSKTANTPSHQIVLLGASNLVLGWPALIQTLRKLTPAPLNLNVAIGMGRSYIKTSAVWFRQLPSINASALWNHLPGELHQAPRVLITDIGNDLVYLFEPQEIAASLRQSIERILQWRSDARIVMTGLPLDSVARIGRVRYLVARAILFPGCFLPHVTILSRSLELEKRVQQLAAEYQITFVQPESHWYGMDPIHVLPKYRETAFLKYFAPFDLAPSASATAAKLTIPKQRIPLPTAAERTVFWRDKTVQQPVYQSADCVVSAW